MRCPKCQFENRDGVKFCEECGAKFEFECPACKARIPFGRKFCGECGHKLEAPSEKIPQELSFDEKLTKIQKYLPKGLTEKILAQRDRIEGERRQVTVMFCDMEGFTVLAEKLGAEDAYAIMDQVYEILIHKVHAYDGTVNEMTGDGIMALFGAPIALEDAPQRAIRASLAIHREISKYNDKIRQEQAHMLPFRMRIGIHTGPVVVGTLGNDLRVEFKAVGDTVNLSSRVEGLAEPGVTYITEDTYKLTEGLFRVEALGEKKIKGKENPVKIYRVIASSTRRTKFDVSAEGGLTPLIGRDREIELLLDGLERVKQGRGQAYSIVSEAGVGKSRLLYEFRKKTANEDVTFLEGKCFSYSRGVAYHLHTDILKANFNINDDCGDLEIRQNVKRGLNVLGVGEDSTLPYLLELLETRDSGIDRIPMSHEAKKDRITETLKRIVLKGSQIRPLILSYEDLHWVDKSSEDVLKHIVESIPGSRVLMIFTYRPEFVPPWGGKSYHNQLNLNRLSNRESLSMIRFLLGTNDIETTLAELILEKTEGIPFYIEEFIKSFKDLKVIEKKGDTYHIVKEIQEVNIPARIQDVIMARVDSLSEDAKGLIQAGAVIGREFSHQLIKSATDLSDQEVLRHLSALKDLELIYERGIYPESTYIFKHALTQEAVYQSLLKRTRQKHHQRISQVLNDHFPATAETHPELLGHHFTEAGLLEQAIPCWQKAGEIAIRRSANIEAISYLKRGLELLKSLPVTLSPEHAKIELSLQIALGNALIATKGYADPEVGKTFNRARVLCLQEKDSPQLYQVLHGLARFHIVRTELQKTLELGEQLLCSAQRNRYSVLLLSAHQLIGTALWFMGKFAEAQKQFEQGIPYYDPQQHLSYISLTDEDQGVVCFSYMAWNLWLLGYPDRAMAISSRGLNLARKLSHPLSMVFAFSYAAILHQCRREPRKVQEHAEAAIALATENRFGFWNAFANMALGWALSSQGQCQEGLSLIQRNFDAWQATGAELGGTHHRAFLADAYGKTEDFEAGLNIIAEALNIVEKKEECLWEAELNRLRGELLLMQGGSGVEVENSFKRGMEISNRQGAKSLELRSALSLSRLWHAQGRREDARSVLTKIYTWFTEGFDTADLKEARALLEVIS